MHGSENNISGAHNASGSCCTHHLNSGANPYCLRVIAPEDDAALKDLILSVVVEHGITDSEYNTNPSELEELSVQFSSPGCRYWVVEEAATGRLLGGGGLAVLPGGDGSICELQKLYLHPDARGHGLGKQLLERLLLDGIELGYRQMYLEIHPTLVKSQVLYEKMGFQRIEHRLGNTGHECCGVFMLRPLTLLNTSASNTEPVL
ncbi:MAG: GNAT family N-acetyltransferase [Vampirovibrio sp.]|nr:GNAT family N-acetyltransferase [Vampirovibrio sp.]